MKNLKYILLCFLVVFAFNTNYAIVSDGSDVNHEATVEAFDVTAKPEALTKKQQRKQQRFEKIADRLTKFLEKRNAKLEKKNAKRVAKGKKAKSGKGLLWISLGLIGGGILLLALALLLLSGGNFLALLLWALGGLAITAGLITLIVYFIKS